MAGDYVDPFLGTNVLPNELDAYDNVSYNLKLYMIPFKYWKNGKKTAPPAETVVIAQTSVTGVQLDNLSLDFVMNKQGLGTSVSASFQLIQPGAADLMDQIMASRIATGHNMYADVPLFLEIIFQGYTSGVDDPEIEGTPKTIAGPYRYQLTVNTVEINIDSTGSTYDVTAAVGSTVAQTDEYFKIPKDMSLRGSTLTEFVDDLQTKLAQYREENLSEEEIHDIIEFDMSDVEDKIGDLSLSYQATENAEQINRLINASQMGISTKEEYDAALESDPTSLDGGVTADRSWLGRTTINMTEKSSLQQFFTTLFAMSSSFLDKVSRKKVFDDPEIDENGLDLNKTFTKWYKLESHVEYQDYDARRNKYAKKIIWKPVIYDTPSENHVVSLAETNLDETQVTKRIQELNIRKAYHYLYTGLNDQILKADISYKNGHTLLMAPHGGSMGNMSTNPNPIAPNMSASTDTSGNTQSAAIEAATDSNALKALTDPNDSTAFNDALQKFANHNGKDSNWVQAAQQDTARRTQIAQALINLNNQGTNSYAALNSADQASDANNQLTQSPVAYKPEPSGYTYAIDLLETSGKNNVIGETVKASNQRESWKILDSVGADEDTNPKSMTDYSTHIVGASGGTEDGSPAATLFGYMYNNANHADILINLGLSVRGDPWYLGKPDDGNPDNLSKPAVDMEDSSTDNYIVREKSDNCFLFTMQTPRVRDPDVDDEDANTGYMAKAGTSYFISGVYMIMAYSLNFSNGMYEVEFSKAPKLTSLSLARYKAPAG